MGPALGDGLASTGPGLSQAGPHCRGQARGPGCPLVRRRSLQREPESRTTCVEGAWGRAGPGQPGHGPYRGRANSSDVFTRRSPRDSPDPGSPAPPRTRSCPLQTNTGVGEEGGRESSFITIQRRPDQRQGLLAGRGGGWGVRGGPGHEANLNSDATVIYRGIVRLRRRQKGAGTGGHWSFGGDGASPGLAPDEPEAFFPKHRQSRDAQAAGQQPRGMQPRAVLQLTRMSKLYRRNCPAQARKGGSAAAPTGSRTVVIRPGADGRGSAVLGDLTFSPPCAGQAPDPKPARGWVGRWDPPHGVHTSSARVGDASASTGQMPASGHQTRCRSSGHAPRAHSRARVT